ncbi:hypothetical protein SERLA73DRAFT_57984 [Serpula lacrymans var. lacrymans S7.3]|uniref:Tetratricopeptide SHNi-TPR domain-containing protein n=1 Tax=Serpula lacrymans var. lacrymans (strain S7.3) TaxID=936435 RepID=F8Q5A0_SERL3|nr:hypothetical protein SERLA73DRAFT_57984 [Serpula lacrymans var. lacrymans S7.3]
MTIENALEHARRAFALRKYESAVDYYATALELMTKKHGEHAPEIADLYFSYGRALLENAISQAGVLGKEQPENGVDEENEGSGSGSGNISGPILSFSGDADDDAVDLFAQQAEELENEAENDEDGEEGEADDGEPEDDFNAAWEVLELARAIYEKEKDGDDDEVKLKLADTYIALGDVSLETEKFDQAISDYTSALSLKAILLPKSSRQIAEAHYKLSMVLDLTSGRLKDAISHAEEALESVECRLAELRDGLSGQVPAVPTIKEEDKKGDEKGKGKKQKLVRDDEVRNMTKIQMEAEMKEVEGLREDLALKVEELKTTPTEPNESAPAMAARALDKELNTAIAAVPTQVNDLSKVVRKKKKDAEPLAESTGKRKAEDEDGEVSSGPEKKAKVEEGES